MGPPSKPSASGFDGERRFRIQGELFRLRKSERLYARIDEVRVKRWGKSPPGLWRHRFYDVNSIRSNAVEEQ